MPDSTKDTTKEIPDAFAIDDAFRDCLFREEEIPQDGSPPEGAVLVEGVHGRFGFHSGRLESHREMVEQALAALPEQFRTDKGGGWSFVNACMTADGRQWGEQRNVDQLFVLGIGLGLCSYLLPREMWSAFPGGVPYVAIGSAGGAQ